MTDERDRQNRVKRNRGCIERGLDRSQPSGAHTRLKSYPHKISIVFFGSGPVAARSLALLAQNFVVEAVVTKPKPAHHRGSFPVLDVCKALGLRVFTAHDKSTLSELISKKPFKSRIGVLVDFGIIVGQDVINYFDLGIVNSHFSLLPQWRGADPITFTILSGQKETGVSLMLLVEKMDEGPLFGQVAHIIAQDKTTPQLTEILIARSHQLLCDKLPGYINGSLRPYPQTGKTTYSRKLTKDDGIIDWHKPADQIEREIRAYAGWPQSRTKIAGKDVIITKAHAVPTTGDAPGTVEAVFKNKVLIVYCGSGYLCIDRLKPAGKPEMTVSAFLAGYGNRLVP